MELLVYLVLVFQIQILLHLLIIIPVNTGSLAGSSTTRYQHISYLLRFHTGLICKGGKIGIADQTDRCLKQTHIDDERTVEIRQRYNKRIISGAQVQVNLYLSFG